MALQTELVKTEVPPVAELYHFETPSEYWPTIIVNDLALISPGRDEYLTSFESPILFTEPGGSTTDKYIPWVIERSSIRNDNTFRMSTVEITAAISQQFQSYAAAYPVPPTKITIYKVLVSDPDNNYFVMFRGFVRDLSFQDQRVTVSCSAGSIALTRKAPRYLYQSYCNHNLFDSGCGLDEDSFATKIDTPLISPDGKTFNHPAFGLQADGYWIGGTLDHAYFNDFRLITNHVGNDITINYPFSVSGAPPPYGTVYVALPGCNKSPDTCRNRYNNFDNFLGFPYIPSKNPIAYGIR